MAPDPHRHGRVSSASTAQDLAGVRVRAMVGIVVVSHSALVAQGVVDLARQMGGDEVALAAAGGIDDPDDPIGTDPFAIKEAIESVWSSDGVLVLMDLGSAVMNAETALDFLEEPARADGVLLCEAPLVEGAVAAVATARIGSSLEEVAAEARNGLAQKVEHLGTESAPVEASPALGTEAQSFQFTVPNRLGLHLRPAGRLVETVGRFQAEVQITNLSATRGPVSARSLSRVSSLGAVRGDEVEVRASGPDALAVLDAVKELVAANFGDSDDVAEPTRQPEPAPVVATDGVLAGVGASPGVAYGLARHLTRPDLDISGVVSEGPDRERSKLKEAIARTHDEIGAQRAAALHRAGEAEAEIFSSHLLVLDDDAMTDPVFEQIDQGQSAVSAWSVAVAEVAESFRSLDEAYQAERAQDVEAVGRQVLARLLGREGAPVMTESGVLVADDLTPGETATLDTDLVFGLVTARGGPTSHSAILARALGIPAVVALGPIEITEGTPLVVDGDRGTVTLDPSAELIEEVEARAAAAVADRERARKVAREPAVTRDGVAIEVAANIGSNVDAVSAVEAGADGVGLLRTEFLFLDRTSAPTEAEQVEAYSSMAAVLDGRPLLLRTLDIGGDKPLPFIDRPREENPFLGVRGLRLGLAQPDLLLTQLRAALRVAGDHPMRIMFPMVATLADWESARALVAQAAEEIGGMPAGVELGVMVEVPSLALLADQFAAVVDFFSVGTNDLTQYTLAAERGNADLATMSDALHPSVLKLIHQTCQAARAHDRWVGVCGELASDPVAIPVLVGMGVTELSMNPGSIPTAKQIVRSVDAAQAGAFALSTLDMASAGDVRVAAGGYLASL